MSRAVAVLGVVVIVLTALDCADTRHAAALRLRDSTLRPLTDIGPESVVELSITPPERDAAYTYERRQAWFHPAYHQAFADARAIDLVLDATLARMCTVVDPAPRDPARYGLMPDTVTRLVVTDSTRTREIWLGAGVPTNAADALFVRLADADTVYQLLGNPRARYASAAAQPGPAPMLDPYVLPHALERSATVEIRFAGRGTAVESMRFEERPPLEPKPGQPPRPEVFWYATVDGREQLCVLEQAFEYVQFLSRLRYTTVAAPGSDAGGIVSTVEIAGAGGRLDILEIRGRDALGDIFVRHRNTGYLYTVAPEKAALLLPEPGALFDSGWDDTIYRAVEPYR